MFGLPWKNLHQEDSTGDSYFMIDPIAYKGKCYLRTKNEASKAKVPIGELPLKAILQWQSGSKDTSQDSLMFISTNKNGRAKLGAPMCPGAWLQDHVQPVAEGLGVTFKVNFRATRRIAESLV